jgi:hypothetical protein
MAEEEKDQRAESQGEGKVTYKIKVKVLNRETGEERYYTLDEAKTWDWANPEMWRIVSGWQVTSFQQFLNICYSKMQKGQTEVLILEAPRFMMCSGG